MADNVFTGKNGTLTLSANTGTPEGAHAGAVFTTYNPTNATAPVIARVTNVEVYVQTALEEFHEIGRRHAVSLHPGDIRISGKLGRAYVNGQLLYLLLGKGALAARQNEPYVQPVFQLKLDLNDPATAAASSGSTPPAQCELVVDGVKLENWVQAIPEEGFVMENVTFKGLTISINDAGLTPTFT
jgi:hypothetical protein